MSRYFLAYFSSGRSPESSEAGAEGMARWQAWLGDLGEAVVNPGTSLGKPKVVSSMGVVDGIGVRFLTGYTIVSADSMEAALDMAKTCPYLDMGTIEVSEVFEVRVDNQCVC